MTASITPIAALVADGRAYLRDIAAPAVQSSIGDPANPQKALAAFILLYQAKDWSKSESVSESDFWTQCPYAKLMGEIATGGKHHNVISERYTREPVVLEFRLCRYNEGGYGVGPYGKANIQVHHRAPTGEPEWLSLKTVLEAVLGWWSATLQPIG